MFKRLIDWVRWYFSEEERQPDTPAMSEEDYQTNAFDRESVILLSEKTCGKTKGPCLFEIYRRYPKSRQMAQAKTQFDRARPSCIPTEEWEARWAEKWIIQPWEEETVELAMLSRTPFIPLQ